MDTNWNNTGHDPGADVEYYVASQIQQALTEPEGASHVVRVDPGKARKWKPITALSLIHIYNILFFFTFSLRVMALLA